MPMENEDIVAKENNFIWRAWHGKEELAFVWWEMGIPFTIISFCLKLPWTFNNVYQQNHHIYSLVIIAVAIVYFAFAVMVWRCSPNVQDKGWKHVARGLIMLGVFGQVVVVANVISSYAT